MSKNPTVENVFLRHSAAFQTRWRFWRLLGITAIVYVITYKLPVDLTALGDILMQSEIQEFITQYHRVVNASALTATDPFVQATTALFLSPKYLLFNLFFVLATGLINSGLYLGRTREILNTTRGLNPEVFGVFWQMNHCVKAWGVLLWSDIKAILWALPGGIVMSIGIVMLLDGMCELGAALQIIGLACACALSIPARLRYSLASLILADDTDRGIRECVKLSARMMKGRKWQYVRLMLPGIIKFVLAIFAAVLFFSLVLSFFGVENWQDFPLYELLVMLSASYFLIQVDMTQALFYLKRCNAPVPVVDEPQPVSSWLEKHPESSTPAESDQEDASAAESADTPASDRGVDA